MSLFGSLTAAISGLTAQSRALGHISDNVANSQTIGPKNRVASSNSGRCTMGRLRWSGFGLAMTVSDRR